MEQTPIHPIRNYPIIAHLGEGQWGALCERCSESLTGPGSGSVVSAHAVHTTRYHNTREG